LETFRISNQGGGAERQQAKENCGASRPRAKIELASKHEIGDDVIKKS